MRVFLVSLFRTPPPTPSPLEGRGLRGGNFKFLTGNFYLREHSEHTKNNKIQSPPLTRGGLGWGQTIFDTLIIT
jgi:hypothetical protein